MIPYYILFAALAACVILAVMFLTAKKRVAALESSASAAEERRRAAEKADAETINKLTGDLARAESRVEALTEQGERDKAELEKLQASFRLEFRNLANELLEEKSMQFKKTNKEAMDFILKPFRDNITDFRERVERIYSEENQQRGALRNEIKNLQELNKKITEETTNLTNALKGNSKVQGDWGEMILETILQSSNLVGGIHYTTQENLKNESGANVRPDVILHLPGGKQIVIDSKVSLKAFVAHAEADGETERRRFLDEHVQSVRKHVSELGGKRYQEFVNSPDFVIMFVPNEPAFLAALQCDNSIWDDAYRKKVIVSSPTNLFALLKIVDDLWKRDNQSRNAMEIADEGAKLYDKFVGFVETLEAVGKGIRNASDSYDRAMGQLKTGSGNLIGRTEKLRKLGVKASKSLPAGIAGFDRDEDDDPLRLAGREEQA